MKTYVEAQVSTNAGIIRACGKSLDVRPRAVTSVCDGDVLITEKVFFVPGYAEDEVKAAHVNLKLEEKCISYKVNQNAPWKY